MLDVDPELILSAGDEVSWLVFTIYMTTSTLNHTHEHTETHKLHFYFCLTNIHAYETE